MTNGFARVCAASEIGANESKAFEIGGKNILVCNTSEGFYAVNNICTHQYQPLEGGKIRAYFIFCPLHGQRFNLKNGAPTGQLTDRPLETFSLQIENGDIMVNPNPNVAGPD